MKVVEAVEHMTTFYLRRIVDSFTKDFPKPGAERAREIIVQNTDELTDPERIQRRLGFTDQPYASRIVQQEVLEALLNRPDRLATEEDILQVVVEREQDILDEAGDPKSLKFEDDSSLEILRAVLEVAIEGDEISTEELALIDRLRRKLGVQERSKQILLAQLGNFPREGNEVHTPSELSETLSELQKLGVVFYCNRLDDGAFVIPEEIVPGVKAALGIEMGEKPWRLLLQNLTTRTLSDMAGSHGLPTYGLKEEKIERIVRAGISPSDALGSLTNQDLYDILDGLPGANVSGTKSERIDRIIDYFVNLVIKDVPEEATPAETYFEYLTELARRDRESLYANDVITKDLDIERAFEEGVQYLFEEKLGLPLLSMPGSDHPDGMLEFRSGDLLMWDTKSKEDVYSFPRSHLRQFKRYIRDSGRRVGCFLVVVPEIGDAAATTAQLLKSQSGQDTDVALTTAADLKWVAESWREFGGNGNFDPTVFDTTGALDRQVLEERMKLFL